MGTRITKITKIFEIIFEPFMLKILTEPNKILRQRSTEIDPALISSDEIQNLIKNMIPTMYGDEGIGLAAPQVGKNIRLCIVGKEAWPEQDKDRVLINPVWQKTSRKKVEAAEGCLSVPKTFGKVKRYKNIHVEALDEKGEKQEFSASDMLARVIQHEVDHLDGILFIEKAKDIYTSD